MTATIRENIVANIKTRMQSIRVGNGYNTDAGLNVFDWLEYSTDATVRPAIIIRDPEDNVEANEPHLHDRRLGVEIIVQANGADAVKNARSIIGDIYKAIGTDISWGGVCFWTDDNGNEMESKHEEDILVSAKIKLVLFYKTGLWDPYTIINC